jgi:hypothetical protein
LASTNYIELTDFYDDYEIGNIGWFTIDEIIKMIRPYNKTKIDLINQIYFFLSIIIDKIKENKIIKNNKNNILIL